MLTPSFTKRVAFSSKEEGVYIRYADIYDDGERRFIFLTFHNSGKSVCTSAVFKIQPYSSNRQGLAPFAIRLNDLNIGVEKDLAYDAPMILPASAAAFNYEVLGSKFDLGGATHYEAPKAVEHVAEGENGEIKKARTDEAFVAPPVIAPYNLSHAEKKVYKAQENGKVVKPFHLYAKRTGIAVTLLLIVIAVITVLVYMGSIVPYSKLGY